MSTNWIRVNFGLVLAILVALTAIFGVAMAAPGPTPPEDPGLTFSGLSGDDNGPSQNTLTQKIDKFYEDAKNYRDDYPGWQRNVALSASGIGILVLLIGVALPAAVNFLRLGLVQGGGLLLLYAFYAFTRPVPDVIPQGSNILAFLGAGEPGVLSFAGRFALFAVAFIGLILAMFVGLLRLTEWPTSPRQAAPAPSSSPQPAYTPQPSAPMSQWAPPPTTPASQPTSAPAPTPTIREYAPARSYAEPATVDLPKPGVPESGWAKKE
jgi:hypothetical protein